MAFGDEDGLTELYDETSSRVYGAVVRILRAPQLADEVTEEVYLEVWHNASSYDPSKSSVLAWLMRLAHNRSVSRVRAIGTESARERYVALTGDHEFDRIGVELGCSPEAELARDAMHSLTEIQRQAVALAYIGGFSQSEVAHLLGVPLGTVRTRIRDGLVGLRDALGVGT